MLRERTLSGRFDGAPRRSRAISFEHVFHAQREFEAEVECARKPGGIAQLTQRVLAFERKRDRVMWRAYANGEMTVAELACAIGVEVARAQSLLLKASRAGEDVDAHGEDAAKQTAAGRKA